MSADLHIWFVAYIDLRPGAGEPLDGADGRRDVLVVGTDDWAIADASCQLDQAGRTVHRCSDSAEDPFPCNALRPDRGCPLDRHPVEVVVVVRSRPQTVPAISEMGAVCGIRAGIPVVMAGIADAGGFSRWGRQVPMTGDIVTSCDEVTATAVSGSSV